MSWRPVEPAVRTLPPVTISVAPVGRSGKLKCFLTFQDATMRELGDPKTCEFLAGEGDDAGQAMVRFNSGHHKVVMFHGIHRVQVPWFDGVPEMAVDRLPCPVLERDGHTFVVQLPTAEWARMRAEVARIRGAAPALEDRRPAREDPAFEAIHACAYLLKRGEPCAKLAGSRWQLSGETVGVEDVLEAVNRHRVKAGLPRAIMAQIQP